MDFFWKKSGNFTKGNVSTGLVQALIMSVVYNSYPSYYG